MLSICVFGQQASATRGCVPLDVSYTAQNQSSYYWDFGNGASSTLAAPQNTFTSAGTFTVQLFQSQGGTKVGEIEITVYPDPVVDISSNIDSGCVPLDVNFTSNITIDPGLTVQNIKWTYGDGNIGNGATSTNTYLAANIYDISIKIETDIMECDKTVNFEDVIEVDDVEAAFTIPDGIPCTTPSSVRFANSADQNSNHSYKWDFGNGQTADAYDPGVITYNTSGVYDITLIVNSIFGCTDTIVEPIVVGRPLVDINFPDTLCVNEEYEVVHNILAEDFDWRYGSPSIRTFRENPTISFPEGGMQSVFLRASNGVSCFVDTTFQIFVEEPEVTFVIDPEIGCADNLPKTFVADNKNHVEYIWDGISTTSASYTRPGFPGRDSLYINLADSITATLEVVSPSGCTNRLTTSFPYQLAEAYFVPDTIIGIDVLNVTFTDYSTSENDIVRRFWDYGDGTTLELDPSITTHTHTYTKCGTSWATLLIEDSAGCIDISKAVEITLLCTIEIEAVPVPTVALELGPFCAGEGFTAIFSNTFWDYHIYTDDNRISHCWPDDQTSHIYNVPGTYPLTVIYEHRGMLIDTILDIEIEVIGSYPVLSHTMDCDDPFTFNFSGANSIDAETYKWFYKNQIISESRDFTFTFDEVGEHELILETENISSGCPPSQREVTVYVTIPVADFTIPDEMCDNVFYPLDARASEDVFNNCNKGYLWEFENQRPREVGTEVTEHQFVRGEQEVRLIVEDINGCTDMTTRSTTVYGIEPMFFLDSISCLPYPIELSDDSDSDLDIVSWDWILGVGTSDEESPFYTFDSIDLHPIYEDSIVVNMTVTDEFGCIDEVEHIVKIIQPHFFIQSSVGSRACTGEEVTFSVIDTAGIASAYEFTWIFGDEGTATGQEVSFTFEEPGRQVVTLKYVHQNGTCMDETTKTLIISPSPVANFTSDVDGEEIVCYPEQIGFTSDPSLLNNGFEFDWDFGDNTFSTLENPTIEFGQGTHTVQLRVTNDLGCADSISYQYTLVGPSVEIEADKSVICPGDEVTFTIVSSENVSSFTWDLGDGTRISDQSPVTHQYEDRPTVVSITLRSEETGCNVIDTLPIAISQVLADFEFSCGGTSINNLTTGATEYLWDFGDGLTSTEMSPDFPYSEITIGQIITLTATDGESGCFQISEGSATDNALFEMPNFFSPNGDGKNEIFGPFDIRTSAQDQTFINVFRIYNRWGELVYDNTSTEGWNGIFNSGEAPPEVYAYYIEVEIDGCGTTAKKGNVTLLR